MYNYVFSNSLQLLLVYYRRKSPSTFIAGKLKFDWGNCAGIIPWHQPKLHALFSGKFPLKLPSTCGIKCDPPRKWVGIYSQDPLLLEKTFPKRGNTNPSENLPQEIMGPSWRFVKALPWNRFLWSVMKTHPCTPYKAFFDPSNSGGFWFWDHPKSHFRLHTALFLGKWACGITFSSSVVHVGGLLYQESPLLKGIITSNTCLSI